MRSPSSSTKFVVKGILKLLPWTSEGAPKAIAYLGTVLVILSMKVDVKLAGKSSETIIVII